MHCRKCGIYFVRYPCPDCGYDEKLNVTNEISEEMQLKLLIQEEALLKPSELKGGSASSPIEETPQDPSLIKPSEINPDKLIDPTDPFNEVDRTESLLKPSELLKANRMQTNLQEPGRPTNRVKITSANLNLQPIQESGAELIKQSQTLARPQRREGETEEQYKRRVRDTLIEVMSLLEELIEED